MLRHESTSLMNEEEEQTEESSRHGAKAAAGSSVSFPLPLNNNIKKSNK